MIDPEYELEKQKIIQLYLDQGWKPITEDIKDGTMYILLVEKPEHPLFDHLFPITIGISTIANGIASSPIPNTAPPRENTKNTIGRSSHSDPFVFFIKA